MIPLHGSDDLFTCVLQIGYNLIFFNPILEVKVGKTLQFEEHNPESPLNSIRWGYKLRGGLSLKPSLPLNI